MGNDEISRQKIRVQELIQILEQPNLLESAKVVHLSKLNKDKSSQATFRQYTSTMNDAARLLDAIAFHAHRLRGDPYLTLEHYRQRQVENFNIFLEPIGKEHELYCSSNPAYCPFDDFDQQRSKYFYGTPCGERNQSGDHRYIFGHKSKFVPPATDELILVGGLLGVLYGALQHNDYRAHWDGDSFAEYVERSALLLCETLKNYFADLDCLVVAANDSRTTVPEAPAKKKRQRSKAGVTPWWFAAAVISMKDSRGGMSDRAIAKHVGISPSTLSKSPHWKDAVKLFVPDPIRPTKFEKVNGKRRALH